MHTQHHIHLSFDRDLNTVVISLAAVTGVAVSVTGVIFHQSAFRMIPLFVSLFVMLLQTRVSRYAQLLGSLNSLLYAAVNLHYGLYASAAQCVLMSFPLQMIGFIRWSRNKCGKTTKLRKMSWKQRGLVAAAFVAAWIAVYFALSLTNSSYRVGDTTSTLFGLLISVLTILAYIEYTALMIPSTLVTLCTYVAMLGEHPEHITYVIYAVYALICVCFSTVRARRLYRAQTLENREIA